MQKEEKRGYEEGIWAVEGCQARKWKQGARSVLDRRRQKMTFGGRQFKTNEAGKKRGRREDIQARTYLMDDVEPLHKNRRPLVRSVALPVEAIAAREVVAEGDPVLVDEGLSRGRGERGRGSEGRASATARGGNDLTNVALPPSLPVVSLPPYFPPLHLKASQSPIERIHQQLSRRTELSGPIPPVVSGTDKGRKSKRGVSEREIEGLSAKEENIVREWSTRGRRGKGGKGRENG
jgi:hypothetical protein